MPDNKSSLINLMCYNKTEANYYESNSFMELVDKIQDDKISWLNINTLDKEQIHQTGNYFGIHSLILEDVANIQHLPKVEDYNEILFFTFKMLYFDKENFSVQQEHLSLVLGENLLITFQQQNQAHFATIREKIRKHQGKFAKKRADYLFCMIIDKIVDSYFNLFIEIREYIENLEDEVIDNPSKNYISQIHSMKKEMVAIRKIIYPLAEALNRLRNRESRLIKRTNTIYFNDVYDHIMHLNSMFETFREMISSLIDLNMSNMSYNMNHVMRTLTVVATIFIPLTFIVGIYGMNFAFMPELQWKYGYFVVLGLMLLLGTGMYFYMKRKHWF